MPLLSIAESRPPTVGRLGRLLAVSFATGFSGAMMPGPLLVLVIQQTAARRDLGAMFWLMTGHALLELVLLGLLLMGLRAVLARSKVRGAIGLVGGAALCIMGFDMARASFYLALALEETGRAAYPWYALIGVGIGVCLTNPYFTGWWATIGTGQLAHLLPRTKREYFAFYLGHEASDFTWYALVALIVLTGRQFLTDGAYRVLILICGILIFLLGLRFIWTGLRFLRSGREQVAS